VVFYAVVSDEIEQVIEFFLDREHAMLFASTAWELRALSVYVRGRLLRFVAEAACRCSASNWPAALQKNQITIARTTSGTTIEIVMINSSAVPPALASTLTSPSIVAEGRAGPPRQSVPVRRDGAAAGGFSHMAACIGHAKRFDGDLSG
jgi:hypothetical protein